MLPPELSALRDAVDPEARDAAWQKFVETHSRLLLHVARSVESDHDAAMDAYAFLLEQLQGDECRRLRAYAADDRGKFTTWLVVVARRLCFDYRRKRYGRLQNDGAESRDAHDARRRLLDHVAEEIDVEGISSDAPDDAETRLRAVELTGALNDAVGALAAGDRLLLKLRFQDDLSAREIARIVKAPSPFHIYRRLNGLLARLRAALARRGVHGTEP